MKTQAAVLLEALVHEANLRVEGEHQLQGRRSDQGGGSATPRSELAGDPPRTAQAGPEQALPRPDRLPTARPTSSGRSRTWCTRPDANGGQEGARAARDGGRARGF